MKEWWKDYFSFTKKERTGAIILSIVIIAIFIAPYFFQEYYSTPDEGDLNLVRQEIAAMKTVHKDSLDNIDHELNSTRDNHIETASAIPEKLFRFNPNTLSAEGWKKLGVREKQIQTIQRYMNKGGKFRRPEDLKRIYGLRPEQADRLIPYVVIEHEKFDDKYEKKARQFRKDEIQVTQNNYKEYKKISVDVNLSDTSAWIALPGIGAKLAARIVNFRDKLGGFYAIEQVGETFGLADSVFQKIRSRLLISTSGVKQIDINKASIDELKQHPYIRWNNAQAIVRYREQHGPYTSTDDLSGIQIITPDLLQKIKPYLLVN